MKYRVWYTISTDDCEIVEANNQDEAYDVALARLSSDAEIYDVEEVDE
jgi:hypothetical protein